MMSHRQFLANKYFMDIPASAIYLFLRELIKFKFDLVLYYFSEYLLKHSYDIGVQRGIIYNYIMTACCWR